MNIERLKQLENFHQNDPDDPFLLYALAIEWQSEDPKKTLAFFDQLLRDHEEYVGTYYHAAKLNASFGKRGVAEDIFIKGINIAERIGDQHALRELKSAYDEFLFEEDED